MNSPSRFRRRLAPAALMLAAGSIIAGGCTNTTVTEYGADAQKNFMTACQADTAAANGTTTTSLLASADYCLCVYKAISANNSGFPFDDLKAFEEKLADAPVAQIPDPPVKLKKAMDGCSKAGPVAK